MQRDVDHGKFYMKENSKLLSKPPLAKSNTRPKLELNRAVIKLQISKEALETEEDDLNDRLNEDPFAIRNEKCIQTDDNEAPALKLYSQPSLHLQSTINKDIVTPKINFGKLEKNDQLPNIDGFQSPTRPTIIRLKQSSVKKIPSKIDRATETATSQEVISSPAKKKSGSFIRKIESEEYETIEPLKFAEQQALFEKQALLLKKSSNDISDKSAEDNKPQFSIANATMLKVKMRK